MGRARSLSLSHRIAVGAIGIVLLVVAGVSLVLLREGPWSWWMATFALLSLLEAIDFLSAALREKGGWPTPAYFLIDLLIPG